MAGDHALAKVLKLRQKAEDEALKKWSDSKQQLIAFNAQLDKIQAFRDLYVKEMLDHKDQNMGLQQYLSYQAFIERLDKTYERQQLMLAKLKDESDRLKSCFLKCRQERRIIEALLEKHRIQALTLEARNEAKFADELISIKHARALIDDKR